MHHVQTQLLPFSRNADFQSNPQRNSVLNKLVLNSLTEVLRNHLTSTHTPRLIETAAYDQFCTWIYAACTHLEFQNDLASYLLTHGQHGESIQAWHARLRSIIAALPEQADSILGRIAIFKAYSPRLQEVYIQRFGVYTGQEPLAAVMRHMQQESDKLQAIASLRHGSAAHHSNSAMVARVSSVAPKPQLSAPSPALQRSRFLKPSVDTTCSNSRSATAYPGPSCCSLSH